MQTITFNVYVSEDVAKVLVDFFRMLKPATNEVDLCGDRMLTTDEVLAEFKLSPSVLSRYRAQGLKYVKSRPNKYKASDVQEFINKKIISR